MPETHGGRLQAIERAAQVLGARAQRDVPIGVLTTYRVGGAAALYLDATTDDDLELAKRAVTESTVPTLVVGKGSNLLVADAGFRGLAIVLSGEGFESIEIDRASVRAGGAVSLPVLARRTARAGLTGLEWAVGVPGSVGGAVRMNAGGHGSEVRETLIRCGIVDLRGDGSGEWAVARLGLGYRRSLVAAHHVVCWAEFALAPGNVEESEHQISEIVRWRRANQPGGQNAGSIFANPPGESAGRLIDTVGLKGFRIGSAHVSEKHANFFQADDGGSADDVRALLLEVQRRVEEATGVRLEPELKMVGFDEPSSGGRG